MIKANEVANPQSCLSRAKHHEWIFVLLARDAAAPETIRFWCRERIRLGKNGPDDEQIMEAMRCASLMEEQRQMGALSAR